MDLSISYVFYCTEPYPSILFLSPNLSLRGARLRRRIPGTVEEPTARPSGNRPGRLRALPCPLVCPGTPASGSEPLRAAP